MAVDDSSYGPEAHERHHPAPRIRVSAGAANLLVLGGVALGAGGVALAFAGQLLPGSADLVGKLVKHGLDAGLLCGLGVVVTGLGLTGRLVARLSRQLACVQDTEVDLALAVDRAIAEVEDVRAGIDHLATMPAPAPAAPAEGPQRSKEEKEALFRMAASLDQLAGKLERRVHLDLEGLKKELERIGAAVGGLRKKVDALDAAPAAPARAQVAAAPVPARAVPAARPAAAPRAAAPAQRPAQEPERPAPLALRPEPSAAADEDAVMVDLDAGEGLDLFDRMEGGAAPQADVRAPKAALPQQRDARAAQPYRPQP